MSAFVSLTVLLVIASLPVLAASLYLGVLALAAREPRSNVVPDVGHPFFDIIVPAHDEETGITRTVESLRAIDYPSDRFRVLVVADNCTDDTARLAAAAGALVLERHDDANRGKGYALSFAFDSSRAAGRADAVVVVDADTVVDPRLLTVFAAHLHRGVEAVQADYAVRDAGASWRTRLMTIALALFHRVRSEARERFAISCGLRGNGMCFTHALLARVPHRAYSIVEDLEYGIELGLAGVRVGYAGEVSVFGEMPSSERASRTQRERWEGGRMALARRHAMPLLALALRRRSLMLADLAIDLLVPPLSYVVLAAAVGLLVAIATSRAQLASPMVIVPWTLSAVAIAGYVARGWQRSRTGMQGIADLCWAPVYLAWKLAARLPRPGKRLDQWVRTARTVNAIGGMHDR